MTPTLWTRKQIAVLVAISTLACAVVFLAIGLDRPETVCQRCPEHSMAVHENGRVSHGLHQETRIGSGAAAPARAARATTTDSACT